MGHGSDVTAMSVPRWPDPTRCCRALVVSDYTGYIAANQSVTAITSLDRHCTHAKADGIPDLLAFAPTD